MDYDDWGFPGGEAREVPVIEALEEEGQVGEGVVHGEDYLGGVSANSTELERERQRSTTTTTHHAQTYHSRQYALEKRAENIKEISRKPGDQKC